MPWIYLVVGIVIGLTAGLAFAKFFNPSDKKNRDASKELQEARFQLEQQKQDLVDHFAQTANLLDTLGKDYTRLYQHMTQTSSELLPNLSEKDNPFHQKIAQYQVEQQKEQEQITDISSVEAPKDYAAGSGELTKPALESLSAEEAAKLKP